MSDPIRIAVAGYGLVGRRHVEAIRSIPGLALAAIVEPDDAIRSGAESNLAVPVYSGLKEMIERESPGGIVLATPTPLHLEHGLICIAAGCPALIEKPIAVTAHDAAILADKAAEAGVPILIGHHRRHNDRIRVAKTAIDDGIIGDVRAVHANCWLYKPDGYFTSAPWRTKKGSGPLSINFVHDIDVLRYLCGDIESVQAMAVASRRGFENEDLAIAMLRFRQGALATISVSDSIAAPWSWEMTAHENPAYPATGESCYLIGGSVGAMSLPGLHIWQHEGRPDWWQPIASSTLTFRMDDPLVEQMRHFARVITGQEEPLVSATEGMKSLQAVEAIVMAAASGEEFKIGQEG